MAYAALMVHLELGQSNAGLLRTAGGLAARFQADVIGIAACQPMQLMYSDGYIPGDLIERDQGEREAEVKAAETEFRAAFPAGSPEWRSAVIMEPLADYLACEARSADLFITGVDQNASIFDTSRHVSIGDLVTRIGRPVLVVPATADRMTPERVLVAWKDTRESRRAVFDAIPLLKKASHVAIVEIAAREELDAARARLDGVGAWLKRHGIAAVSLPVPSTGDDMGQLNTVAGEQGADVIVAGAYGHSQLREWALGGMTSDFLLRADRCTLVSH